MSRFFKSNEQLEKDIFKMWQKEFHELNEDKRDLIKEYFGIN